VTHPTMLITPYGKAVLAFPFDRWLVESIKAEIPGYSRTYDPATKQWEVDGVYIGVARLLLTTVFPDAEIIDESPRFDRPSTNRTGPKTSYTVLHLLPSAPPELVETAYKTLARLHHPDRGGATETMQELNQAIKDIRRTS